MQSAHTAAAPPPPPPKIYARLPLCKHCRANAGVDYVSLKRQFIAALYAYHTAKRVLALVDRRMAGLPFRARRRRLGPVYTTGKTWERLCSDAAGTSWYEYFTAAVAAAEYAMTRTCCCLGCQFAARMERARIAVAFGEAVKGRGERGAFEEGVEILLDDAARVAELMMQAGETI